MRPILYSYRRCPYAMRARMAIFAAGIDVEIREISLRDKPAHMLAVSPKGTVPVLCLPDGTVLEQSLDIMHWALKQHDPMHWLLHNQQEMQALIEVNDGPFKRLLDRYKYPERYPEAKQSDYREQAEVYLQRLQQSLLKHTFLLSNAASMADVAIFPFIRQFAAVDAAWFVQNHPRLNAWLQWWVTTDLFIRVMEKQVDVMAR